jgi:hypothetical protein
MVAGIGFFLLFFWGGEESACKGRANMYKYKWCGPWKEKGKICPRFLHVQWKESKKLEFQSVEPSRSAVMLLLPRILNFEGLPRIEFRSIEAVEPLLANAGFTSASNSKRN